MTSDDIKRIAIKFVPPHMVEFRNHTDEDQYITAAMFEEGKGQLVNALQQAIREAVAQAYEEAAKRAFETLTSVEAWDYPPLQKGAVTANAIRALKDSLNTPAEVKR